MTEKNEILDVLLAIKKKRGLKVDAELIKSCYDVQKKHQFDIDRNTVNKMRNLVELSLSSDKEDEPS